MRIRRIIKAVLALFVLLAWPVAGETDSDQVDTDTLYAEQWAASGAQELWNQLTPETREQLNRWGITDFSSIDFSSLSPEGTLEGLLGLLAEQSATPLAAIGMVLGIVLLCSLMDGMRQTAGRGEAAHIFSLVGAAASYAAVLVPLAGCIQRVCEAVSSVSVFMTSFVPVYGGIMLAAGQAVSAASYQTIVLFVAELLTLLVGRVIVPCLVISLALGLTGAVTPEMKLNAVGDWFHKGAAWLLTLTTSVFVGLLSIQGIVGAAADSLSGRAIRFSLASFVPVVGGALSEAFNAVKGCLSLLRTTMGGVGVLTTALIVLPPLLSCVAWAFCLSLGAMVAELFALPALGGLLRAAQNVVKTLIGVLAACALFMIVATTIVTVAGLHA